MEIVIMLFVLVGGSIAFSAWKKHTTSESIQPDKHNDPDAGCSIRKCLTCGHVGEMKTWISNYSAPKLIVVAGFLLGYIPGLIFLAIYWGKYKCPSCGTVGKNQKIE
jgi:hypothetical protein